MENRNSPYLLFLLFLAAYIWLRKLPGMASPENTLPILLSLPLFLCMGSPWRLRTDPAPLSFCGLAVGMAGFIIGLLLDFVTLLAACWTFLLWIWISSSIVREDVPLVRRLMILPFLAFPWINVEGSMVGWYFRLSGAWVTAGLFSSMGFEVAREGTGLAVHGLPVGIGEACSGVNVLQSMLIAGSALVFLYLGRCRAYWPNVLALVGVAWLANTLRIVILCITALTMGQKFALGVFHALGGWLVLFLMLCLSWGALSLQAAYLGNRAVPASHP